LPYGFKEYLFRINKNEPTKEFAEEFHNDAAKFVQDIHAYRNNNVKETVTVGK
jgi:hypothetical protein